jgi:DNA-binding transcriptional ArsR family regulator
MNDLPVSDVRPRIRKFEKMKTSNLADHSNVAAALLSAMANPKRLMILCSLVRGEVPVGVLATQVGLSQSALSQHLSKLRAQKLVKTRRDAQTIYYSSSSESVMKVLSTLEDIYCEPEKNKSAA